MRMRASGWVLWSKLSRIQSLSFVIGKTSEARLRTTSFRSDEEGIITIWQLEVCLKITGDEVYTYRFRVIISLMQILSFLPDAPLPSKKRKTTEKQMNSFDAVNIYSEFFSPLSYLRQMHNSIMLDIFCKLKWLT